MTISRGRVATHWGTYHVTSRDGEVIAVHPVASDPDPSSIGDNLRGALRGRSRIARPAVRAGWLEHGPGPSTRRGGEPFVEVSWERLFELLAGELERVRAEHGNQAIFGGSYGWGSAGRFHHAQSQVHRFLNTIGGYTRSVQTYSHAADEVVLPHLVGDREWFLRTVPRWSDVAEHGRFVLAFGGLPRRSVQICPGGVGAHRNGLWQDECARAGVEFCVVSPTRTDTGAELGPQWIAVRPNTDVALMLGMCHVLLTEDRYDREFVERCCIGFDTVRAYLLGERDGVPKTAEWAAAICDVPAEQIRETARKLAAVRSLVTVTWSLQRQHHGEMTYWAGITLAAMAGSMGLPGGGFGPGYSSMHNAHVTERLSPAASLPQGRNAVDALIPVARIADLLLNPGGEVDFDGRRLTYPDIRLVYWVGGNPFHHHQDLNKLLRAWQRPDTIVVHEPFWNAMAKHADIVVPVATSVERDDIVIGKGDPWFTYSQQVTDPPPGIRTDYEVFTEVAARLGAEKEFTEGRTAREWVRELYERSISHCAELAFELPDWDTFRDVGSIELPYRWEGPVAFARLREDPGAAPLATPSGRIELFSQTVASFGYDDCPGYAAWLEPEEWLGSPLAREYPLHLLSPQPDGKMHSQLDQGAESARYKRGGRAVLVMNPADAADRGIRDGDVVEVASRRGRCLAAAGIDDGLRPGVVQLPTGAWYDPLEPGVAGTLDKHGNPNVLTLDRGTSRLGQGPSSHTCLVEVTRWEHEPPPPVTAHDPPPLVPLERPDDACSSKE